MNRVPYKDIDCHSKYASGKIEFQKNKWSQRGNKINAEYR